MSRKSRERRERMKAKRPDDYYNNGIFELARFGSNVILRNNYTPEQHAAQIEYLCTEYPTKYDAISQKICAIREKVAQCDPYELLMYIRNMALSTQLNVLSEADYSTKANAIVHAQEYVQSILVSTESAHNPFKSDGAQEKIYTQITGDFEELYKELQFFYHYWAAHILKTREISKERLSNIVEAQYMYLVRGNRYQIFELEPLKHLLPPHCKVLQELFGVSAADVINGIEKLQYSLSQGYADTMMSFGKEYDIFLEALESGMAPEKAMENAKDRTLRIAGKLFGSDLIDVMAVTGWDSLFIDALSLEIGEYHTFWNESEFSGWPIVELPVIRKPFIKINGKAYAFLYYALFDNIYRNIQKIILHQKPEYLELWKRRQTQASEEMVKRTFLKLLPGAQAYIGNYYPVRTSLKQMNENDIIVVFHNYLFIIEVKAGSFPATPPITDFDAHIIAYQKLAEAADSQCSRTLNYITHHTPAQFYNRDKNPTFSLSGLDDYDDIFTFSVTVDNFNDFAAKAEKLSVITLKERTVVISYDDLLEYSYYFESPIRFLHFLKQRKAAMAVSQFQVFDEFDHLGLYIYRNLYAKNPSQYSDLGNVFFQGFRKELDEYFSLLYVNPSKSKKPDQCIPRELSEIIEYLDCDYSPQKILLSHYLLDLSADGREDFAGQIRHTLKRQRELGRSVPMVAFGDIKYCAFIGMPGITPYSFAEQLDYTYAAASRNKEVPVIWISLEYNEEDVLVSVQGRKCFFSDLKGEDIERINRIGVAKARDWVKLYKKSNKRLRANDYCPCGSGKKFKHCCINNI